MIIFLSYASEQRDVAEEIKLALSGEGQQVFFLVSFNSYLTQLLTSRSP